MHAYICGESPGLVFWLVRLDPPITYREDEGDGGMYKSRYVKVGKFGSKTLIACDEECTSLSYEKLSEVSTGRVDDLLLQCGYELLNPEVLE